MYISKKLQESSIAENLLYLWQVEDIIRAYGGDIDRLKNEYLCKFQYAEEESKALEQWYVDLIAMMRGEGVMQTGHLQIHKNKII